MRLTGEFSGELLSEFFRARSRVQADNLKVSQSSAEVPSMGRGEGLERAGQSSTPHPHPRITPRPGPWRAPGSLTRTWEDVRGKAATLRAAGMLEQPFHLNWTLGRSTCQAPARLWAAISPMCSPTRNIWLFTY